MRIHESMNLIWRSLLLVSCLALSACSREGVVLEKDSNKPLAGAYVITEWFGNVSVGIESRSRCYSAEVTRADAKGRFRSWTLNPLNLTRHHTTYAYVPNYEGPMQRGSGTPIVVEPRRGTSSEKFRAAVGESIGGYCEGNDRDWSFLPVRKARLAELESLAKTSDELKLVGSVRYGIEFLELGEQTAMENERRRAGSATANGSFRARIPNSIERAPAIALALRPSSRSR